MRAGYVVRLLQFVVAVLVASTVHAAEPKPPNGPIAVGDLAEYVSGLGPIIGEVVSGPDPWGYYVLSVPASGDAPIKADKLQLIQRAGTPNAAFSPGDVVDVRTNLGPTRASVVKVNGGWCRLQAPAMVGWAECKELRVVRRADGSEVPAAQPAPAPTAAPAKSATGGSSPLIGTYANADSSVQIEFKPKGTAFFSLQGLTQECTHKGTAQAIVLTCFDEDMQFTVDDDGALRGPPDSFVARLKKK